MAGWTEIESTTLASPAASVSFTTGLGGYAFFRLTAYIVNDANAKTILLRFNNDSGMNYSRQTISALSTTVEGARETSQASVGLVYGSLAASEQASFGLLVAKPSASVKAQVTALTGYDHSTGISLALNGGEWNNTSNLISAIALLPSSGNFDTGSSFLLEGLAA